MAINSWLYFLGLEVGDNGKFRVSDLPARNAWSELTFQSLKKSRNGKELADNEANEVVIELLFLWLSRLFLLKKIEKMLLAMHENAENYHFLTPQFFDTFESLDTFITEVITRKPQNRGGNTKLLFGHLPYLNSPIFELQALEKKYVFLSDIKSDAEIIAQAEGKPYKVVPYLLQLLAEDMSNFEVLSLLEGFLPSHLPKLSSENWASFLTKTFDFSQKPTIFFPISISPMLWQEILHQFLIKSLKNKALQDEDKRKILDYQFEKIEKSLQLIDTRDGEIFQYFAPKPIQKKKYQHAVTGKMIEVEEGRNKTQRQKIQEAIFITKTNFLQNQFFLIENQALLLHLHQLAFAFEGIDSAFYTQASGYTEWNLLPNVQRNFRQVALSAPTVPLENTLPSQIDAYCKLFKQLQQTNEKYELQKIGQNLQKIQQEWRLAWAKKEGRYAKWQKLQAEYYRKYADTGFFALELSEEEEKEKAKLQADILLLEQEIGIKSEKKVEKLELRWDYPEIWDKKGNFTGFDVLVLGYENEEMAYSLPFLHHILQKNGKLLAVFPSKLLYKAQYAAQRTYLLTEIDLQLAEMQAPSLFTFAQKQKDISPTFQTTSPAQVLEKQHFQTEDFNEISLHLPNEIAAILYKMRQKAKPLKEIAEIKRGATIKKSDLVNTTGLKILIGQEIQRYQLQFENLHIATNHKEYVRLKDFFEAENIVYISRNGGELIATIGEEPFAYSKNVYGLVFPSTVDKYFAVAMLNAPLLSHYYRLTFQTWEEYSPNEIQAALCERLPFVLPDVEVQKNVAMSSKQLIKAYQNGQETHIEKIEAELLNHFLQIYGINPAEYQHLLTAAH
ncbi:MAG: TaqI-like C-terminal specificity domain-containing protein [Bacteroidia bacterium]